MANATAKKAGCIVEITRPYKNMYDVNPDDILINASKNWEALDAVWGLTCWCNENV